MKPNLFFITNQCSRESSNFLLHYNLSMILFQVTSFLFLYVCTPDPSEDYGIINVTRMLPRTARLRRQLRTTIYVND